MNDFTIKYNELTAEEFISLWESVWDGPPTAEQTKLALAHTLFRVSVYDGEKVVAMARMLLPLQKKFTLDAVAKTLKIPLENHHRAVDDAGATAYIFIEFINRLKQREVNTLEEVNAFGNGEEEQISKIKRLLFKYNIL